MKAIHLTQPGLANLRVVDAATPVPRHDEVLVNLKAASLNYIDLAIVLGHFPAPQYPLIPVADGAGEIVAVGASVVGLAPGDRVIPHFMPMWSTGAIEAIRVARMRGVTEPGSLAEFVAVPAASVVRAPSHLSFDEASSLPIAATTAWNAVNAGGLRAGRSVLLLGTGGVSIFALQFAKAAGATVIIISSSDAKLARARTLGADHLINYRTTPDWSAEVLRLTGGRGVDLVVESVGAATFAGSLASAAHGATVFAFGFVGGADLRIDLMPIVLKALRVQGNNTGSVSDLREAAAIEAHRIRPQIDRTFVFSEAANAFEALAQAGHFGKLTVSID